MAKVIGPSHSLASSGSLGSTIYSRGNSGFYAYEKPVLTPSNTDQQAALREAFQYCSDQWNTSEELTQAYREQWKEFSSLYPQKGRFGHNHYATDRQWFISVNQFKRLAGFNLKLDPPTFSSCSFEPTVTIRQNGDGLIAELSEALTSESLFYCSVIPNQSVLRNFIPRTAAYGTLWKAGDETPFVIYPNALLSGTTARQFIKYKFIDTRGIQSPTQTTYFDCRTVNLPSSMAITADTYILSRNPSANFNTSIVNFCSSRVNYNASTLLYLDIGPITPGFSCLSALLHVKTYSSYADQYAQSFQILTSWHNEQATWNNRLTGTPWGVSGGQQGIDFLVDPSDTQLIVPSDWTVFDVTSICNSWFLGYTSPLGFWLRPSSGVLYNGFCSLEYATEADRPYLTFTW